MKKQSRIMTFLFLTVANYKLYETHAVGIQYIKEAVA